MSEQFANLASTTLAAGYTAGSGSIKVVSATSFPASGTFTLVIRDLATKAIKLLFRVNSVAGAVFSGSPEGADAPANAGDLVDGTMVTVASLAQFKTDILAAVPPSSPGFIQSLTAPVAGNFSQKNFNVGSNVVSSQLNLSTPVTAITLLQHDPSGTNNLIALAKAKLAATFTVTMAITMSLAGSGNNAQTGIWLSDGGAGPNNLTFGFTNAFGVAITVFSNFTNNSSVPVRFATDSPGGIPLLWLRIQETASARIYSTSSDGVNFAQFFTESNTAHFTTLQYGFMVQNLTGSATAPDFMGTLYSFAESTP